MKTYYTIYKVTNKLNGKTYIGSHKTRKLDDGYMGSGTYLKRAIEKHGEQNFSKEILFIFNTPEEMYQKEAELVNEDYLMNENTYNLKVGGFGGFDYINSSGKNYKHGNRQGSDLNLEIGRKIVKTRKLRFDEEYERIKPHCTLCGKVITPKQWQYNKNKKKLQNIFCSRSCNATYYNRLRFQASIDI